MNDIFYMKEALKEAQKAYEKNEVPIGAILVFKNKIIARGHNLVEEKKDAAAHAELNCLRRGAKYLGDWRLIGTTLYTTVEPCIMCAGAILAFRVKRLVWGAPDLRIGGSKLFFEKHAFHPNIEISKDILLEESKKLLKDFFKEKRLSFKKA